MQCFYHPTTKLGGGNVFRHVSIHGGGVGISGTKSLPGVGVGWGWLCRRWIPISPLEMGPRIQQDTVGKRAVRILLECFLVAFTAFFICRGQKS